MVSVEGEIRVSGGEEVAPDEGIGRTGGNQRRFEGEGGGIGEGAAFVNGKEVSTKWTCRET